MYSLCFHKLEFYCNLIRVKWEDKVVNKEYENVFLAYFPYFLKEELEGYKMTLLSVCVPMLLRDGSVSVFIWK
jgi:hypothetical protein